MWRVAVGLLAGLFILCMGARPVSAQGVAESVMATALLGVHIRVEGENDLLFGTVHAGQSRTVNVKAPSAGTQPGHFTVRGERGAEVSITFNFPSVLVASGGHTLTIGSWTPCHHVFDAVADCTFFSSGALTTLRPNNGRLWVWLGATVTSTFAQPVGTYSGTVEMTVLYTGL